MADPTPFEALCNQVTKKISEGVNNLAIDTKNIIEEQNLKEIPDLINKKTFTSTSDNELAKIFIKTIIYYIDNKYKSDAEKNKKLLKYIKLLQAERLDLFTVNKICFEKFKNFYHLIEYRYNSISDEAKNILNNLKFDSDESEKEKIKEINEKGYQLTPPQFKTLSKVFENIKNVCNNSYRDDSIFNKAILETRLSQCLTSEAQMSKPKLTFNKSKSYKKRADLYNEFEYLKKVINQEYENIDKILEQCHRGTDRKLLTAKRRIENAYKNFIPPKPSRPLPPVPTDGISDDPPPLGPVKKRQRHTPPADPPPKPPIKPKTAAWRNASGLPPTHKPLPMPPRRTAQKPMDPHSE